MIYQTIQLSIWGMGGYYQIVIKKMAKPTARQRKQHIKRNKLARENSERIQSKRNEKGTTSFLSGSTSRSRLTKR